MSGAAAHGLVMQAIEELAGVQGVRGVVIATPEGAYEGGAQSGLERAVATDVAKTVRRMAVASSTVGAPLRELVINFGPARMLVTPIHEDATMIVLLERSTAVAPVRSLLAVSMNPLRELLLTVKSSGHSTAEMPAVAPTDEIESLMAGELGPVLKEIETHFSTYVNRDGGSRDAQALMREQMREWLLCCSPSPYTFPLLLDGLAQVLDDAPDIRSAFMVEVQDVVRNSAIWSSSKAAR